MACARMRCIVRHANMAAEVGQGRVTILIWLPRGDIGFARGSGAVVGINLWGGELKGVKAKFGEGSGGYAGQPIDSRPRGGMKIDNFSGANTS